MDRPTIRRLLAAAAAACASLAQLAPAQSYPVRPVRLVVPFAPGGSTDTLARTFGVRLSERIGQQVVIDNRSGGNGNIGMEIAARAAPDGYTIVMGYVATLAINPALYGKLPYDPVRDFSPISQVTVSPNILAVHAQVPAPTLQELVALARAKPGGINYASGGVGTIGHLSAEMLKHVSGTQMTHVVYKGSGQAVVDLLSGQVQMMVSGMPSVLPHVKTGRLRAVAVTGLQRSPAAPEVPTIAESGYPGFEATGWFGVLAPPATPREIVARLHRELVAVAGMPDVRDRLTGVGFDVVTSTPEQFAAYIKAELGKWKKVVKDAGIRAE